MTLNKYPITLSSYSNIYRIDSSSKIKYWFYGILITIILFLFIPWTQNIKSSGRVTTRFQEQRPQEIHSPIPGRITKWWVKEGDYVNKGDTIVLLSEIKEDYLDPKLVSRTEEQLTAKKGSIEFYTSKVGTADQQIASLQMARKLKIEQLNNKLKQLENKLQAETAEWKAAQNESALAKDQYDRQIKMFEQGLVSQTQLQQRNATYQNILAKAISAENKVAQTKQDIINTRIEQNSTEQEYTEKISKAEGDKYQSMSMIAQAQGDVAKLENQVASYAIRNGMYLILAQQSGQIVQAAKSGIGEVVKEGEPIAEIVPNQANYAVEIFVRPVDLPLLVIGQKVRFMFDGFPAIVFSGWPQSSYGTYGGKLVAIENNISENGMFRVLVTEDENDRKWPPQIRMGNGAQAIILLKDVPIWYEIWRNINGFPPDFYTTESQKDKKKK